MEEGTWNQLPERHFLNAQRQEVPFVNVVSMSFSVDEMFILGSKGSKWPGDEDEMFMDLKGAIGFM